MWDGVRESGPWFDPGFVWDAPKYPNKPCPIILSIVHCLGTSLSPEDRCRQLVVQTWGLIYCLRRIIGGLESCYIRGTSIPLLEMPSR